MMTEDVDGMVEGCPGGVHMIVGDWKNSRWKRSKASVCIGHNPPVVVRTVRSVTELPAAARSCKSTIIQRRSCRRCLGRLIELPNICVLCTEPAW